jgi:ankyrin repeat protein
MNYLLLAIFGFMSSPLICMITSEQQKQNFEERIFDALECAKLDEIKQARKEGAEINVPKYLILAVAGAQSHPDKYLPILEWLLNEGANPTLPDENGISPLGFAASNHGHPAANFVHQRVSPLPNENSVKILIMLALAKNSEHNASENPYTKALSRAFQRLEKYKSKVQHQQKIVDTLKQFGLEDAVKAMNKETGFKLLFKGAEEGNLDKINQAIDCKVDIDRTFADYTALHKAVCRSSGNPKLYLPVIRSLLQAQADPNKPDSVGLVPVMEAVRTYHPGNVLSPDEHSVEIVKLLLAHKANVNQRSHKPAAPSALGYAIEELNFFENAKKPQAEFQRQIVKLLRDHGATFTEIESKYYEKDKK